MNNTYFEIRTTTTRDGLAIWETNKMLGDTPTKAHRLENGLFLNRLYKDLVKTVTKSAQISWK